MSSFSHLYFPRVMLQEVVQHRTVLLRQIYPLTAVVVEESVRIPPERTFFFFVEKIQKKLGGIRDLGSRYDSLNR
jgi:hypothetical protein